jgi:hypothetical protein
LKKTKKSAKSEISLERILSPIYFFFFFFEKETGDTVFTSFVPRKLNVEN